MLRYSERFGRVIAHRGASGRAPENTIAAFRAAAEDGAHAVEFDVSCLGDGVAVLHHDATLGRTVAGTAALDSLVWADLADADAGSWFDGAFRGEPVPRLEDALAELARLGLAGNLEMKPHGADPAPLATACAAALARIDAADRILVSSFDFGALNALRERRPKQAIALLWTEAPEGWGAIAEALGAEAVHLDWRHTTPEQVSEARARGIALRVYTCNAPAKISTLRDAGLASVITDHPRRYLNAPDWTDWTRG